MTEVSECLCQGDARWRSEILGDSTHTTIGQAGCLLVCVAEAAQRMIGAEADPRPLNTAGRVHRCFSGASAIVDKLAKVAGLACGPRIAGDVGVMRSVIVQSLLAKSTVLLHVDYDSAKPGGDAAADHWVLALSVSPDAKIIYADPATGKRGHISMASLSAPSGWRDARVYSVRGLRVLTALQ